MTIPDISADIPNFKKNLKRLKKLQKTEGYLEGIVLEKSTNGVGLLNRSKMILKKAEEFDSTNLDFKPPVNNPMNMPEPPKPQKISDEKAKVIAPKMKQISEASREDKTFTVPSISPEENYASEKYSRLMNNYATGIQNEVADYDNRIKEYVTGQKGNWLEDSATEFGKWAAVEQFRSKLQKLGMTGALDWLSESTESSDKINPYEYLETEEGSEFNEEFRDALGENEYYQSGYVNSLKNLYKTFAPQLYQAFVEESDDENTDNRVIVNALRDLPEIKDEKLAKRVLKQSITEQLQKKYQGNSEKLARQVGKYVEDNYSSLKLKEYRSKDSQEQRLNLLNEFKDTDTIQSLLKLQGYREEETDKLTPDHIGDDYPVVINKLVAELRVNPKFHAYSKVADSIAARMFGDAFEKYYDPGLAESYLKNSPHYIRYVLKHVNSLIDDYNTQTPGNVRKIPIIRPSRTPGEITEKDIEGIQSFFKTDGDRLRKFLSDKHRLKGDISAEYLDKLDMMNQSGGLSHMTDSKSHAAVLLDNLLTENRGLSEVLEKGRGKSYYQNGIAYILDPRNKKSKLKIKGILNSPIFMDPEFLGKALNAEKNNMKSSRRFPQLVKEILPLITGSYFKERSGAPWEKLAFEDYQNNPFIKRLKAASQSPENFEQFLQFFNGAMDDIGARNRRELFDKSLFNSDVENFLDEAEGKPSPEGGKFESRRQKTAFEDRFFKTPDQHADQMNVLASKNWMSDNAEIGSSVKIYAKPIYENFFAKFADLDDKRESGQNVEAAYFELRKELLNFMNKKVTRYLFSEKNDNPYNYFAEAHEIEDPEIRNGVLEALYILKNFDSDFHSKLLNAEVDEKGVHNPDLTPKPVAPIETPQEQQTLQSSQPMVQEVPTPVEPKQEPVQTTLPVVEAVEAPPATAAAVEQQLPGPQNTEGLMNVNTPVEEGPIGEELSDVARIKGGLDSAKPEQKPNEPYRRRRYGKRTYSEEDSSFPPKKVKQLSGRLTDSDILHVLATGGVRRGNDVVDWEDATEDEKRYTLFNALLATSTPRMPDGLNPVKDGKVVNLTGLDSFIPRKWLEDAIKRYIKEYPGGKLPFEYKDSPSYKKYKKQGLTEVDPWNLKSYVNAMAAAQPEKENPTETGEESSKKKKPSVKFNFGSNTGLGRGGGLRLYNNAAMRAYGNELAAKMMPGNRTDLQTTIKEADGLSNYLLQAVAESLDLDENQKIAASDIIRKMQEHYRDAKFSEYEKDRVSLSRLFGGEDGYGKLNAEPVNAEDPYRKISPGKSEEETYQSLLKHPKVGHLLNQRGMVHPTSKHQYFNVVLNDLDEKVKSVTDAITEEGKITANPTKEQFKKTAVEVFKDLDEVLDREIGRMGEDAWKRYKPIFDSEYPKFKRAVYELNIEDANDAKKMLEKIPKDVYDFDKALSGIMPHLFVLSAEKTVDNVNEAKKRQKVKKKEKQGTAVAPVDQEITPPMEEKVPEKPKFNEEEYKQRRDYVLYQLDNVIKEYDMPPEDEESARHIGRQMIESIMAADDKAYDISKKQLLKLMDRNLERSLFPISNELMAYRKNA